MSIEFDREKLKDLIEKNEECILTLLIHSKFVSAAEIEKLKQEIAESKKAELQKNDSSSDSDDEPKEVPKPKEISIEEAKEVLTKKNYVVIRSYIFNQNMQHARENGKFYGGCVVFIIMLILLLATAGHLSSTVKAIRESNDVQTKYNLERIEQINAYLSKIDSIKDYKSSIQIATDELNVLKTYIQESQAKIDYLRIKAR
jgi:predicted RND superfamily exporter protein